MYAQDYDERTPGAYGNSGRYTGITMPRGPITRSTNWWKWPDMIYPYVKNTQLFICPSVGSGTCTYAGNQQALHGSHTSPGKKLADITRPAQIIMLYDGFMRSCGRPHGYRLDSNGPTPWCYGHPRVNELELVPDNPYARDRSVHNDGCNYSFMDGHVKWLQNEVTYCPQGRASPAWGEYWNP